MESFGLIYLLSISDNVSSVLNGAGNWCFFLALGLYAACHVRLWATIDNEPASKVAQLTERHDAREPVVRKFSITVGVIGIVLWLSSTIFPSVENVLKAYALIEGSKVINADNAELAAEAIGKRFDKFLDIVDKGINGRSAEATPTAETPAAAKAVQP